jgi:hypothetical protein
MVTFYALHVRRKTGEWQTNVVIRQGNRPNPGEVIDANLHGKKVEVRVMTTKTNFRARRRDEPTVEVHAEEI